MTDNQAKKNPVDPSEITPEVLYFSRRKFIKLAATMGVAAALAACAPGLVQTQSPTGQMPTGTKVAPSAPEDKLTPYETITTFNNYYEFGFDKESPAKAAANFKTSPWSVQVYGLVKNPMTYSVDDLVKKFPPAESVYRLRCVEGWSLVIPWLGFSLASLLKEVQPTDQAKFVRFEAILDPKQMPGQNDPSYSWPYQEGLRLDEAMHPLTILATGLYGKPLPPQDGAPIRLVVPWKYGFKSIKAITKIELVTDQPATLWSTVAPNEYGFYSNVNPAVPHPRWSQESERRIGEVSRRPTLPFNGYADQVAYLYDGMDLKVNY